MMFRKLLIGIVLLGVCVSACAEESVVRLRGRDRITYTVPEGFNDYEPQNNAIIMLASSDMKTQIVMTVGPRTKDSSHEILLKQLEEALSANMTLENGKEMAVRELPYLNKGKRKGTCKIWVRTFDVANNGQRLLLAVIQSKAYFYVVSVKTEDERGVKVGLSFLDTLKFEKDSIFG